MAIAANPKAAAAKLKAAVRMRGATKTCPHRRINTACCNSRFGSLKVVVWNCIGLPEEFLLRVVVS